VMKGSIAIDGVSLTVAALTDESLSVAVIPHTWAVTSLGERSVGDRVNLESDLLGKHVARLLDQGLAATGCGEGRISEAALRQAGFWE